MNKIAIIGASALFPGSSTLEEFWENLIQKKDLTGLANDEDFGVDPQIFYKPQKGVVDKCYSLRGGYIRDFDFDPNGFNLSAEFLKRQDKIYQWALHAARAALKDGGYWNNQKDHSSCGLILGNLSFPTSSSHKLLAELYSTTVSDALKRTFESPDFELASSKKAIPQNEVLEYTLTDMVSQALGLKGTHFALDAACASSLYAIKLACDELEAGKSDMMLAGAISASDQLFIHMGFSIFYAYAPMDKKFAPFDKESSGLVSSEGVGLVLLKRLPDAIRDGDKILGVLNGIGLSNDGRGKYLLSPNPKGQQLAFERAYQYGQGHPKDTSYLECHATGTPLGDVTELNSIANFFSKFNTTPLLGSVKSNMGHLLTGAGMTGLLKVLKSMEKGIIPPNINLEESIRSDNNWEGDTKMLTQLTSWKNEKKQAGINSFGFGGTNAHMVVENYIQDQSLYNEQYDLEEIQPMSIIGMDAHFGSCTSLNEFAETIFNQKQLFTALPEKRWKGIENNTSILQQYGFEDGKPPKGAYITEIELDLLRYKIQPKEAEVLQPQQALILKVADQAIKDAGLKESDNVAVLIAMETEMAIHQVTGRWDVVWQIKEALQENNIILNEAQEEELTELCKRAIYRREGPPTPSEFTSFIGNLMASRISALWDFSGPAFTVSEGEQSFFRALTIAQHMLSKKEVNAVVVGAVDFAAGFEHVLLRNKDYKVNKAAKPSLSFKMGEQGWLVGEGSGVVVLKRSDAIDGDKVYAEIDDIGQVKPLSKGGYIELDATGITAKDEVEMDRLLSNAPEYPVALGSVKTNIGHTFAASGAAALIKTALCLYHRVIPGIPNWTAPKKLEAFETTNYYFPQQTRPWLLTPGQDKRLAAVNGSDGTQLSLSASSINANKTNTLIQRYPKKLLILSGNNDLELQQVLLNLKKELSDYKNIDDLVLAYFHSFKESKGRYRLILMVENLDQAEREIDFFQKQLPRSFEKNIVLKTPSGSYFTPEPIAEKGKIAFVYPGSATVYEGIGRDLFQYFPGLLHYYEGIVDRLDDFINSDYLFPKTKTKDEKTPEITQNAIAMMSSGVFYSSAFTQLLRDEFKLEPNMALGYSMGECSSMWYALNIWHPEGAKKFQNSPIFKSRFTGELELLAEHWGITSKEAKERWTSLILLTSSEKVASLVKDNDEVFITFINTPQEVIISGDKTACLALAQQLQCNYIQMPFQNIIHQEFCEKDIEGLLDMHHFEVINRPSIDFYSSLTHQKIALDSQKIAENAAAVCYNLVDFPKTIESIYEAGARIFIELGANATCTNWIKENLKGKEHLAVSINHKGKSDVDNILFLLAQLLSNGLDLDLSILFKEDKKMTSKRQFLKKIIPGGKPMQEYFKEEAFVEQFKNIRKANTKKIVAEPALAYAGYESISSPSVFTEVSVPEVEKANIINKNSTTNMPIINTPTTEVIKPASVTEQEALGENGLRLQDFESGEQLEGKEIIFSQEDLEEFANGKIENVFGPEYKAIDTYGRRVRLPMDPYLLVSRVTKMKAKLGVYEPSTMTTEYDIPYNAWYTTDKQIPAAVCVESGQCDLLLISYLGIDLQNKGKLVYRLLDCTLTFVDDLPYEGQTLRYDISINSYVRNGENLLFFFSYNCYVQDRLVLKMRGGCAGFFEDDQLSEGNGVVYSDSEKAAREKITKKYFTPLLETKKRSFSKQDLQYLIEGDIEKCFGDPSYNPNGRNLSLRIPPEKILMLDRITSVDLQGGAYGLGYIVAEKDLHPDDWYFPCHFLDDEVLAGSLQSEGGGNLLRFFMLMLGLQRLTKDARFQPYFDIPQKVRCRRQVIPSVDNKLIYQLEIKEIGLYPNPYVIGDLEIISNGVVTVHFQDLGLQLREKTNPRYLDKSDEVKVSPKSEGALLNEKDITTFALGSLEECFGPEYAVYNGRKLSRQPNTDLQLISRVLKIDGTRGDFSKPSTIYAEYDVPENAWYYEQNSNTSMPYSILMEIALQPCGLMGAYLGSTLQFPDKDLYFRNLDGEGELFYWPNGTDFRGKTIHNKAVLTSSIAYGESILQRYTFELSIDGQLIYKGNASFGFFSKAALASQVGLDKGQKIPAWYVSQNLTTKDYMQIKLDSLYGKMKLFKAPETKPHYRLAGDQLNLLDKLIIAKDAGEFGKGYIHATKFIKSYDWFFTCHFYQDPVMPGSLGIEAMFQAMQVYALQQDLGKTFESPKFVQVHNHKTVWKYRGQILQEVDEMHLEIHIKNIEETDGKLVMIADANLWNTDMRIYSATDLAMAIIESPTLL